MKRVAFLSFDWDYEIMSQYYVGMEESLGSLGDVQLVIFNAFGNRDNFMPERGSFDLFSLCDLTRYDGFIIQGNRSWPPEMRQEVADRIIAMGKPLVSVNYMLDGAITVGTDNYAAMFGLVKRVLLDKGCTHPAFVNGLASSWEARERVRAFGDACAACGVKSMRFYSAGWQMEEGTRMASEIIAAPGGLPDAVFCCNDDLAVGVQEAFLAHGIRVPDDVLIAGFDNRVIGSEATPRITTVDRGYRAIGALAIKTIVELMEGKTTAKLVSSDVSYVLSESCGYPNDATSDEGADGVSGADGQERDSVQESLTPSWPLEGATPLDVLLEWRGSLGSLGCPSVFVTVSEDYLQDKASRSFLTYGNRSLLVAHYERGRRAAGEGVQSSVRFKAADLLPSTVPLDGSLYMVLPLRQATVSIGTVVTEGVSPLLQNGKLADMLMGVSSSIERYRSL